MSEINSTTKESSDYRVYLRLNKTEYKMFQDAKKLGLSARDVFELLSKSCCGDADIQITKKSNNQTVVLKRGLLHRNQEKLTSKYLYQ